MPRKPRTTPPALLDWRPLSYWDHPDPVSAIIANVKGEVRRTALRAALEGRSPDLPVEQLMRDELPDDERRDWGSHHPVCMGGEYLPGYLPGEIEIARAVFDSVTCDVVSIRAHRRRRGGRIHYRVVDEYPEDHRFIFSPRFSVKPLTLGAILDLVWTLRAEGDDGPVGFFANCLGFNLDGGMDREQAEGFITVESPVYPDLGRLFDERLIAWAAQAYPVEQEEEDEGEEDAA